MRLPALYMLAQQPGLRIAFRTELRVGEKLRVGFYRNDTETLAAFPYAYDAWAFYFSVSPLMIFEK